MTYFDLDSRTIVGTFSLFGSICAATFAKLDTTWAKFLSISPWAKTHKPWLSAAKTPRTSLFSSRSSLSISDLKKLEKESSILETLIRSELVRISWFWKLSWESPVHSLLTFAYSPIFDYFLNVHVLSIKYLTSKLQSLVWGLQWANLVSLNF